MTTAARSLLLFALAFPPFAPGEAQQPVPPARAHAAMAFDPVRGKLILSGGGTRTEGSSPQWITLGDLWSYDGARWERVPVEGVTRSGHKLVLHRELNQVLAVGGNDNARFDTELMALAPDRWIPVGRDSLSPRTEAAVAYDPVRRRLVVFGGIFNRTNLGTTHEFDGTHWREISASGPAPRNSAVMAYHPPTGRIVLFGGAGDGGLFGDTWTWDGSRWTLVDSSGPGPLMGAAFVLDESRNEIVVFGGGRADGLSGATWIWNGARWREYTGPGPSPRIVPTMGYDPVRRVVVLFGGRMEGMRDSNETWEWNGQSWTRKQ